MGAVVLVRIMRMVSVRWCFETLVSTEILVQMVQTRWPVHYFRFRELNRYGESFFEEALEVIFLCGIMRLLTCCCVRVHSKDRVTVTSGRMFRYIGHIVRRRYFPGYRLTSNTILYFAGKPGRSRRSVRHVEKRFRIADEFVHVSFSRYLLHYTLLVVVPQRSAQFVVIHRRSILLNTPSTSHLNGIKERKKKYHFINNFREYIRCDDLMYTSSGSMSLNSIPRPVHAMQGAFAGSSNKVTKNCHSCREPLRCC